MRFRIFEKQKQFHNFRKKEFPDKISKKNFFEKNNFGKKYSQKNFRNFFFHDFFHKWFLDHWKNFLEKKNFFSKKIVEFFSRKYFSDNFAFRSILAIWVIYALVGKIVFVIKWPIFTFSEKQLCARSFVIEVIIMESFKKIGPQLPKRDMGC